jgi:hypothetical protein
MPPRSRIYAEYTPPVISLQIDEMSKGLIHPDYKRFFYKGIACISLSTISLLFPFESLKIIATTTLIGIGFKTIENVLLARDCIGDQYFTTTGQYERGKNKKRIVRSLNPITNGLILGPMHYRISLIAGTIFAILARTPFWSFSIKIASSQISIYFGAISLIFLIFSQIIAKLAVRAVNKNNLEVFQQGSGELQNRLNASEARKRSSEKNFKYGKIFISIFIIAARAGLLVM